MRQNQAVLTHLLVHAFELGPALAHWGVLRPCSAHPYSRLSMTASMGVSKTFGAILPYLLL